MSRPDIPQMPLRILEAVRLLHRMGYLGVRILPGMNASGSAWRIIIFNVVEWDPEDEFGNPYLAEESSVYSTADDYVFNNEIQFPSDVTHVAVAEAILESMPSLQRTTPEQTGNQEYASWYAQLLSQVHNVRELPVAYADYFDDSRGWELGWGSKHFFPRPPEYVPAPAVQQPDPNSDGPHRDELYVLGLCEQVLKADCVRQKTFPWLVGDASRKTNSRRMLPVDGYWEQLDLVVEYHERQHSEPVPHFDKRMTVSGMTRGEQRKRYDARKAELIPANRLTLVIIDFRDFQTTKGRIVRHPERDITVVAGLLERALAEELAGVISNFPVPAETVEGQ